MIFIHTRIADGRVIALTGTGDLWELSLGSDGAPILHLLDRDVNIAHYLALDAFTNDLRERGRTIVQEPKS